MCKYAFLKYLKRGIKKKIGSGCFKICIFFKYLKSVEAKNCAGYFQICKYAFLNISEGDKQKMLLGMLRFGSIPFSIFKKFISKNLS